MFVGSVRGGGPNFAGPLLGPHLPPSGRAPRPLGEAQTQPGHVGGDRAYSFCCNRRYLRRRHVKNATPRPAADREQYRRRNEVERTINRLKAFPAVATKRAYVFHGTVTEHDSPLAEHFLLQTGI